MPRKSPLDDAKSITASLGRSSKAMNATVRTANSAVENLAQDGEVIGDTLSTHKYGLKTELGETRRALRQVKIAAFKEKWLVWGSLGFFTSTVTYIIAKRTRLLTIAWLFLTGAYQGGSMLGNAFGGAEEVTPAHTADNEMIENHLKIKETPVDVTGDVNDFLNIDIINFTEDGTPIPPQEQGPLSKEDQEVAAMYERMKEELERSYDTEEEG